MPANLYLHIEGSDDSRGALLQWENQGSALNACLFPATLFSILTATGRDFSLQQLETCHFWVRKSILCNTTAQRHTAAWGCFARWHWALEGAAAAPRRGHQPRVLQEASALDSWLQFVLNP